MFWKRKVRQPTEHQLLSIEILKNEVDLSRPIEFGEIVMDNGMRCYVKDNGNLGALVIEHNFIYEIQEDDSVLFIVQDVYDKGWTSHHPLHLIDPNGEIHDL